MKFLNRLKTHQKIFLFSILIVASIALFDILSMSSGVFGSPSEYTLGNYTEGWWGLFFQFNVIMMILISSSYYFFGKHDVSESFALFAGSYILWFTGLADILYFWFQKIPVPETLPWLTGSVIIGKVTEILGYTEVTNISLYISVAIGLISTYFIIKFLKEKV